MRTDTDTGVPIEQLAHTARRRWPVVLLAALLGALAVLAVAALTPPKYESVGKLLIGGVEGSTDAIRASASIGSTYAGILTSDEVLREAADLADIPADVEDEELREAVDVTSNDRTRVLTITTTWEEPVTARRMTTALVWHVLSFRGELPERGAPAVADERIMEERRTDATTGQVTVVAAPNRPDEPVDVPWWLFVALGGLLAGAVTFAVYAFLDLRRDRHRAHVLESARRHGLLGVGRREGRATPGTAVAVSAPDSRAAAEYRTMASRLLLRTDGQPASVAVLGTRNLASSAEVSVNLALTLASSGQEVRFVDLSDSTRTTDILRHAAGGDAAAADDPVTVTTASGGRVSMASQPGPVTEGHRDLTLDGTGPLVVVHADPLLTEPRSLAVARQVDGVVLVVSEDTEDVDADLADADGAIRAHGTALLGTVVAEAALDRAGAGHRRATGQTQRAEARAAEERQEQHQHHES